MNTSRMFLFGALALAASNAMANSPSLNEFSPKVLPVLVQVDSHGNVTKMSPSIVLAPRFSRLLRQTVDELITAPAHDRGHAVPSQFIMNLALRTSPRLDGAYDARFSYVSTSPVPSGSWHWVRMDGHRLALMDRNAINSNGRLFRAERAGGQSHWDQSGVPRDSHNINAPAEPAPRAMPQSVDASSK